MIKVSVIICTYDPDNEILSSVLTALRDQSLEQKYWELIIIDNNSSSPIPAIDNINWHSNFQIKTEKKPGLVYARIAGFNIATPGSLLVFVDDDNILRPDYLRICAEFAVTQPVVGCFGGKSIPSYATPPPVWFPDTGINLGCQDLGDQLIISQYRLHQQVIKHYPEKSPIGTGMAVTYQAFAAYINALTDQKLSLGRKGADLTSGEDNDIVLTVIKSGFEIAYLPLLVVDHIIPEYRYQLNYLQKMAYKSNISWVKLLEMHQINPHRKIQRWTLPVRKARAWFRHKAWKNEVNYIKWKGACGIFQGLSELK